MLGIKLNHVDGGLMLSQAHYVESFLALYGMEDCRSVLTPMVPNSHLEESTSEEGTSFDTLNTSFKSAVGSLSYLSVATQPDISFAVSSFSQFLEIPGIQHWNSFLHVLRYLKGTIALGVYNGLERGGGLCAYSDAYWGN
ncbi:hypothetical protein O181_117192 [Austropuccinia psidii MF-1]|uniref:Reverse transcriptase Ty1/copia-type domain-containing protein n=1 Tax=Austropuccinia psidii MF-1 TaxID=1389203 RepID=A0A9Q3PZ63_9BASI|nr:hypothetical protein [Austropuccinia psidii MF-1]